MTTRYQRGNQKPTIEEGQTTLCSVVYTSSIDRFWLPLWYLVVIGLSFLLLITPLVSCSHSVVCPSSIDGFWLPLWYLVVIVLSVLRLTLLITPLVSRQAKKYRQHLWLQYTKGVINSVNQRTDNTMTTRYQMGNQKLSIEEGQTTIWLQDTKGVIRSRPSKKDRQHYDYKIPKG
jgi:hypothetical protein